MDSFKHRLLEFYEKNEAKVDIGFFLGGVLFDVFTLSAIDDPWSILQQVVYLAIIGSLLYFDFLGHQALFQPGERFKKFWVYRDLAIHFFLGSLLSVYSLFYIKSASFFASFLFILVMLGLMVANEVKAVQRNEINLKIALYVICVFSFFSMMFPVILGFVGWLPFLLSLGFTVIFLGAIHRLLARRIPDPAVLRPALVWPSAAVVSLFFAFYLLGWIPPVPLSVQAIGVYHKIEKLDGNYILSDQKPWWEFWNSGDQDFIAEPGDIIYIFARIFSPSRFSDSVILHWQYYDPREGWKTTDRIPMKISGGREGGYRGYASKANYVGGDWRILVETTDGREIGRLKFNVTKVDSPNPGRLLESHVE